MKLLPFKGDRHSRKFISFTGDERRKLNVTRPWITTAEEK
jgi:hypothetical protein